MMRQDEANAAREAPQPPQGGPDRIHTGLKRPLPAMPAADSNSSKTGTGATTSAVEWSGGSSPCTSQATTRRGRKRRRASMNEHVSSLDHHLELSKPTAMVVVSQKARHGMASSSSDCQAPPSPGRSAVTSATTTMVEGQHQQQPQDHLLLPMLPRHETVWRVERRVANMFKELDLLLQAEKINRRVMYRWSGADKLQQQTGALDEGINSSHNHAGYCTWGRELVKQALEDAINDIRLALNTAAAVDGEARSAKAMTKFASCAEAARRLTVLYLNKASERLILENEKPLHDEVMSSMGNLWFRLLPRIPKEEREQFQQLVVSIGNGGGTLVAAFRCAFEFAKLDLLWADDAHNDKQEEGEEEAASMMTTALVDGDQVVEQMMPEEESEEEKEEDRLMSLLGSDDLYKCDAYICLWEVAECLSRQRGDVEVSSSSRLMCQEFRLKALDAEMWRATLLEEQESRHKAEEMDDWDEEDDEEDDEEEEEDDEDVMEEEVAIAAISGGMVGGGESLERRAASPDSGMMVHESVHSDMEGSHRSAQWRQQQQHLQQRQQQQPRAPALGEATESQYSSFRRSSQGQADGAERWASKAALEGPEQELYIDYLSRRQHEYRRVMTPEFRAKIWTFLQDLEPLSSKGRGDKDDDDVVDPNHLLLTRARPFLSRVASTLSTEDLPAYLDLVVSKLGYESTLMLLEPIIIHEKEAYSSARVSRVLSWAVAFDNGAHMATFLDRFLAQLSSRTELRQLALEAVVCGPVSFPLIDRALSQVPRQDYDNVAVELCRLAARSWGMNGWGAYMLVLRVIQRIPSLRLYLRCRAHFVEPVAHLLRPLMQHLDPCGELSIGIRLVEGMVTSAVASIARSLETQGTISRQDRAQRWLDFAFAGVRGGQFPPCLIEKLCAHPTFMPCALGPATEREFLQAMVTLLGRLTELAHSHPRIVAGPCRLILHHYEAIAKGMSCIMDASVVAAGEGILRAVGELVVPVQA